MFLRLLYKLYKFWKPGSATNRRPQFIKFIKPDLHKLYSFINMKSVLVGGTTIEFTIDKELINDKTPNKEYFILIKNTKPKI